MRNGRWSWLGDHMALDAVNTVQLRRGHYVELVAEPGDLQEWAAHEAVRLPDPVPDDAVARFHAVRDPALRLLRAAATGEPLPAAAVRAVDEIVLASPSVRVLADGGALRLVRPVDALTDLVATIAAATVELLTGSDRHRLARCDAPSCGQLYLRDRTNQVWCGPGCGARARSARHDRRSSST